MKKKQYRVIGNHSHYFPIGTIVTHVTVRYRVGTKYYEDSTGMIQYIAYSNELEPITTLDWKWFLAGGLVLTTIVILWRILG